MIFLEYVPIYDEEDFEGKRIEVEYICDVLWDHGYTLSVIDAYKAWLAGNSDVWEHPFDYSDAIIVTEILSHCVVVTTTEAAMEGLSFDEWLDNEMTDYEPKVNAQQEGFADYDPDTNSSKSPF